ncbi:hypothetical protein HPB49_022708 [Dermacentor silvarum]|uniref:Uncharacterized protein n=1 Tax=Dermacentor silvarum TaxID=543639 RepID=A0ACB8D8G5_DERSI|nr:hypothetical protein HPB49_022708 [Dermacentor silvarum]
MQSRQCASAVAATADMSQDDVVDAVDMTPEEILVWREKFVYSDTKRPSPTSPSTLKTRPQVSDILPRPPSLPATEYKMIIRVDGGVNCANIHQVSLRGIVIKSAGLPAAATSLDRLRANEINNTIIISTPCMDRADRYLKIATLTNWARATRSPRTWQIPKNTCRGIIKLPASLVEGNLLVKLRDSNRTIKILAARRMGSTDSILVTFEGSKAPFYIDYLRTVLRYRPYGQKVEACATCWQLGHGQDVCPNVTICLCPKCGTPDPPEDHSSPLLASSATVHMRLVHQSGDFVTNHGNSPPHHQKLNGYFWPGTIYRPPTNTQDKRSRRAALAARTLKQRPRFYYRSKLGLL